MSTDTPLPERLSQALRSLPDSGFAGKLERTFGAAAHAMGRLAAVDLISYETIVGQSTADLSLWEAMAPVVRDTVLDVNGFLMVAREEMGFAPEDEPGDEPLGEPSLEERAMAATRESMRRLAQQITELGERIRRPEVVADRWNLLAEVQAFRTRFREQLGTLVYDVISLYNPELDRSEVIPGFNAEVLAAITVRGTVTDLKRLLGVRKQKVLESKPHEVQGMGQELMGEMDVFGRTEAFKLLRAQDKRQVIELRASLKDIVERPTLERAQLLAVLDGYLEFAETLSQVNNREFLISHDRKIWAALGVALEQVDLVRATNRPLAAEQLAAALTQAQALYGRDGTLDGFLRRARRLSIGNLDSADLKKEVDKFRELLANLPMY